MAAARTSHCRTRAARRPSPATLTFGLRGAMGLLLTGLMSLASSLAVSRMPHSSAQGAGAAGAGADRPLHTAGAHSRQTATPATDADRLCPACSPMRRLFSAMRSRRACSKALSTGPGAASASMPAGGRAVWRWGWVPASVTSGGCAVGSGDALSVSRYSLWSARVPGRPVCAGFTCCVIQTHLNSCV
jgi:hypothetical protein